MRKEGRGCLDHRVRVGAVRIVHGRVVGDPDDLSVATCVCQIGRETQAAARESIANQGIEPRLLDRRPSGGQEFHSSWVRIVAHDIVAGRGHARCGDRTEMPQP